MSLILKSQKAMKDDNNVEQTIISFGYRLLD